MTTRRQWHAKGLKRPPPGPRYRMTVIARDTKRKTITIGLTEWPHWVPKSKETT